MTRRDACKHTRQQVSSFSTGTSVTETSRHCIDCGETNRAVLVEAMRAKPAPVLTPKIDRIPPGLAERAHALMAEPYVASDGDREWLAQFDLSGTGTD